jgi:Domain of unknown function (DUF3427)
MQQLVRELVDWRLAEYLDRTSNIDGDSYTLKISHSGGQPILFLPPREQNPDLPEGWTDVRVGDATYSANFVKVAVNVICQSGSEKNILSELLRKWFGTDAGAPGTRHRVMLRHTAAEWHLQPLDVPIGPILWKPYKREEVPGLFGLSYSDAVWRQGFVRQNEHTFLFVTLEKNNQALEYQYKDHFVSPIEFQWQSQNRTTQASNHGRSIRDHKQQEISVHLFVRPQSKVSGGRGAPFIYCGPVEFVSWEGEKPVTVIWKLSASVPQRLQAQLQVPHDDRNVR